MYKKAVNILFITAFLLCLSLPLVFTNLKDNVVSESENRVLTGKMQLFEEDGSFNRDFLSDFENWFNDNVGFRKPMVNLNGQIQYYLFDNLTDSTDVYLGPEGEYNYATSAMLRDYQHFNLLSEEEKQAITEAYRKFDDYLSAQGIQYFYVQCWDKHSIYPEEFPKSVMQYGAVSRTDQIVEAIEETSVTVINPKQALIEAKDTVDTYSKFGDPTHWTPRGAYIGYLQLMEAVNAENDGSFPVLTEDAYDLTLTDQGMTYFGKIHNAQMLEKFSLKEVHAELTNEKLTLAFDDYDRNHFYTNESAGNRTRVLVIGDSYFDSFLMDDLSESFYETIMIRGDYLQNYEEIIETYQPDIVISENAERADRSLKMARIMGTVEDSE